MDKFTLESRIDLIAEIIYVDIYDVRKGIEVYIPDVLGYHRARHYYTFVAHKILEQGIFFSRKLDLFGAPCHLMSEEIEFEVGELEFRRGLGLVLPQDRADPGKEFLKSKRLGKIIVGSRIEPQYLIFYSLFGYYGFGNRYFFRGRYFESAPLLFLILTLSDIIKPRIKTNKNKQKGR